MKIFIIFLSLFCFISLNAQSETVPKKVCELVDVNNVSNNIIYDSTVLEVKPEFVGGNVAMQSFIKANFKTSANFKKNVATKIIVMFIVEKDGSLTDIKVIKDAGFGTANEAIRVLKLMPQWLSGNQNGVKVRCKIALPITIDGTK